MKMHTHIHNRTSNQWVSEAPLQKKILRQCINQNLHMSGKSTEYP